jgi:DNA-binding NtrC family response regulator
VPETTPQILLVDDDAALSHFLTQALERQGWRVRAVDRADRAAELLRSVSADVILLDNRMPGLSGVDFLAELRRLNVRIPVVLMTAYGTADLAIKAMKAGAYDYILKPFDLEELLALVREAIEASRLVRHPVRLPGDSADTAQPPAVPDGAPTLVGTGRAMREVFKLIGQVADSDAPVLIRGETGTGKELVARAVVAHGRRSDRPFVAVNCAAIPEQLLESELFGHERGSFTGADRRRIGRFEQADGGTILLDEIGDMTPSTQAKILRVLQQGEVLRVGGDAPTPVQVRVLAATHRDLEADIAAGRFREDLFYRLNVVTIRLPPLRERGEDIALLAKHFLAATAAELERPVPAVSDAAWEKIRSHRWPGNVRQLANVMRRAVLLARGGQIAAADIDFGPVTPPPTATAAPVAVPASTGLPIAPHAVSLPTVPPAASSAGDATPEPEDAVTAGIRRAVRAALDGGQSNLHPRLSEILERELLAETLRRLGGNQVQTARLLGIARSTLRVRMQAFGLE